MTTLNKLQHEFLDYLVDGSTISSGSHIVERVESTSQQSASQRLTLYGNAYVLRLKEALMTDYEHLHAYLGDALFDRLMLEYINTYPSKHTSLRYFSEHMVELLKQVEPFNELEEVIEIAIIEQAFAHSFDAADAICVELNQLATIEPSAWATLTLQFHPAVQILPQQYNSFQIWQALSNEKTPPAKTAEQTSWLIWRENLVSRYRALDAAELSALSVAMSGGNFADVCEALYEHFDEQQTPVKAIGYLQMWINEQMVSEIKHADVP